MTELTLDSDLNRSQLESLLLVHCLAGSLLLIIDDILVRPSSASSKPSSFVRRRTTSILPTMLNRASSATPSIEGIQEGTRCSEYEIVSVGRPECHSRILRDGQTTHHELPFLFHEFNHTEYHTLIFVRLSFQIYARVCLLNDTDSLVYNARLPPLH
jgi:hypothetical protein